MDLRVEEKISDIAFALGEENIHPIPVEVLANLIELCDILGVHRKAVNLSFLNGQKAGESEAISPK